MTKKINKRESAALINSLSSGVVPRIGLRHIAVGRLKEVEAYLKDLETIQDGGAAFRFISGRYGSGKSFLIQLIRNNAMDRDFVVMDCDLSPERRLTSTKNGGLATYRELMQNLSTKTTPNGHGLDTVLQKWINGIQIKIMQENNLTLDDPLLIDLVSQRIQTDLMALTEMAFGFSFSKVISAYWQAIKTDDEETKQGALRWLRGEFATKTEAKKELPFAIDTIINDQNWYDFLKLFALFIHMAGYQGLLIFLDEGVNLFKIVNKQARNNNYEKILTMFNDMMQGKAQYIGMTIAGTPEFITDERRGLYSYEALHSRLVDSRFASQGFTDYAAPVLKLNRLSNEELFVLLERLCEVHGAYNNYEPSFTSEQLWEFLNVLLTRLGADEMVTTREVSREFLGLLNTLHQYPETSFEEQLEMLKDHPSEVDLSEEEKELYESASALFEDFTI